MLEQDFALALVLAATLPAARERNAIHLLAFCADISIQQWNLRGKISLIPTSQSLTPSTCGHVSVSTKSHTYFSDTHMSTHAMFKGGEEIGTKIITSSLCWKILLDARFIALPPTPLHPSLLKSPTLKSCYLKFAYKKQWDEKRTFHWAAAAASCVAAREGRNGSGHECIQEGPSSFRLTSLFHLTLRTHLTLAAYSQETKICLRRLGIQRPN